jgi:DNA polymerase-3 subunit delta'
MSRCQRVLFGPLSRAVLVEILGAQGVTPERARRVAPLAGGSAARAFALAGDGELERRRARARAVADAARAGTFKAAADAAAELAPAKDDLAPTLELLALWYRDAAALAAGAPGESLAHADEVEALATEPGTVNDIARRVGAVLDAQQALLGYANAQLTLERMILALRPGA